MKDENPAPLGVALQTHGDLLHLKTNINHAITETSIHIAHLEGMLAFVQDRLDTMPEGVD